MKREVTKEGKGIYANIKADGDGFGGKKIVEKGEMTVRTRAEVFICKDEVEKKDFFAMTDKTRSTAERDEMEERKGMQEVAEMGSQ